MSSKKGITTSRNAIKPKQPAVQPKQAVAQPKNPIVQPKAPVVQPKQPAIQKRDFHSARIPPECKQQTTAQTTKAKDDAAPLDKKKLDALSTDPDHRMTKEQMEAVQAWIKLHRYDTHIIFKMPEDYLGKREFFVMAGHDNSGPIAFQLFVKDPDGNKTEELRMSVMNGVIKPGEEAKVGIKNMSLFPIKGQMTVKVAYWPIEEGETGDPGLLLFLMNAVERAVISQFAKMVHVKITE